MTTAVEDFRKYAKKVGLMKEDEPYTEEEMGTTYLANIDENCPPAHQFMHSFMKPGHCAIRRVFRHFNGLEWESGTEAVDNTIQRMFTEFHTIFNEAYAAGFICGKNQHPAVISCETAEDWHELATNDDFRIEAQVLASTFESDPELRRLFFDYFESTCRDLGRRVRFTVAQFEGEHKILVHKVWDVYDMVNRTVCGNLFATGYEFGKDRAVQETLNGILDATKEE